MQNHYLVLDLDHSEETSNETELAEIPILEEDDVLDDMLCNSLGCA